MEAQALLDEAFDMLEPVALAKSLHLEIVNRSGACVVHCEPERIIQVFSNLVGNATKFSSENQHVTI